MKAAFHDSFGSPDVLTVTDVPKPTVGKRDILVRVYASPVTYGDRRLRAADFPGPFGPIGRLMFGIFRPRYRVPGTMFAGRVVTVGPEVTRFAVGDDVFGSANDGAQAEYLAVRESGAVAKMLAGLSYAEAAALPYGAGTARHFLTKLGKVRAGQRVLVVGAMGGVGRYAVQLAAHLGAEVTGVASRRDFEAVKALGASRVIDYATEDFTANGQRYDVIFDTSGVHTFRGVRESLTMRGRFLTLYMTLGIVGRMLTTNLRRGRQALSGVALGSAEDTQTLADLAAAGAIRPVIDRCYPLAEIAEAHRRAEQPGSRGDVVVTINDAVALELVA